MNPHTGKLLWRCRRGTRELDCLLSRYLQQGYPSASTVQQQAFVDLLQLEDDQLQHYVFGDAMPTRQDFVELLQSIKQL